MLKEIVNNKMSYVGDDIIRWVKDDAESGTDYEKDIASRLMERLQLDGKPRIKSDIFYRVNHKKIDKLHIDTVYLTRDRVKSPRDIPHELQTMDLVNESDGKRSFAGRTIRDWACWQNSSASNPFYMDGSDIVTTYVCGKYPIRDDKKYFLTHNSHGVVLRRDTEGTEGGD